MAPDHPDYLQVRANMLLQRKEIPGVKEAMARVADMAIPGPAGPLAIRVYTPAGGPSPFPVLLYFHGGGWVAGSLDTHDNICRALANRAACVVVAVDYRLAPEHKFPAALQDCYAAAAWVAEHAALIGGDAGRVALGGDSAGGNLAAAVTLLARENGGPSFIYQCLVNTATDLSLGHNSWYREQYLTTGDAGRHPYASPLLAPHLGGLPPVLIVINEFDIFRAEGEAYGERLAVAGVPVTYLFNAGVGHFGPYWSVAAQMAWEAIEQVGAVLRAALAVR